LAAVLPLLGGVAISIGWLLLEWLGPAILPPRPSAFVVVSLIASVLYGLAFFTIEDLRHSRHQVLSRLVVSHGREMELHAAKQESELVALQARINPHFVFNTLNAITALIHEDPAKAEETILRLARLMRHMLEMGERTMVSLETEVGVASAYLEIEKVRLGSRLRYRVDVPDDLRATPLPGMLLQPLVENAVKHGVRQGTEGGEVRIDARSVGVYCQIEVIDNGPGFSAHVGTGQSMRLLRQRLALIYGQDFEFTLQRDARATETVVALRIPLRPGPERRA
jgi:LytS/YehU family sensor histidine kinase